MVKSLRAENPRNADATVKNLTETPEAAGQTGEGISLDFLSPSSAAQSLGRLEEYEILGVIGSGAMGIVLKAHQPDLDRIVAIKVLRPELASNALARRRFLSEARKAAAVTHDHVVTIHGVGEAEGLPYIVMAYISGVTLQERNCMAGITTPRPGSTPAATSTARR